MTKLKFATASVIAVAIAAPWVVHNYNEAQLREDNHALRQQVDRLTSATEQLSSQLSRATNFQARANEQLKELVKLRGEVGALRLRAKSLEKSPPEIGGGEIPVVNQQSSVVIPRDSWAFKGYATPEASFESCLFAAKSGDLARWMESMTPEAQQAAKREFQGKTESDIVAELINEVRNIADLHLDEKETLPDGRVSFRLTTSEILSEDGTQKVVDHTMITFTNIANEWKMAP